jgi:enoyl-CoA hydratase
MADLVSYVLDPEPAVATVTMDDGKANALSPAMFEALNAAFDRAEADGAVVVLAGRPDRFSGGFDLNVLRGGGPEGLAMVRAGFELSVRMLTFPAPVVVACTGHAIAMGSFLVLSGDLRIGADGPYRIQANEVAIGLVMPIPATELLRMRLAPAAFQRAVGLSAPFTPAEAVAVGYLDQIVDPSEVLTTAQEAAAGVAALDRAAHHASKLRARAATLDLMRAGIASELAPAT